MMRPNPVPDLLQPSLSAQPLRRAPYSHQTGFLAAFFGGPLAALAMAALNAHRAGRLRRDWIWLLAALLAWVVFEAWWYQTQSGQQFDAWLLAQLGAAGARYTERALALIGFGVATWLHRREQRAATLMGLDRPNGWIAGFALIVAGAGLTWGLKEALA